MLENYSFEIVEGLGATGILPLIDSNCTVDVCQPICSEIPYFDKIYAELLIDGVVLSTSYPGVVKRFPMRADLAIAEILFRFPSIAIPPQQYGIRMFVVTNEIKYSVELNSVGFSIQHELNGF